MNKQTTHRIKPREKVFLIMFQTIDAEENKSTKWVGRNTFFEMSQTLSWIKWWLNENFFLCLLIILFSFAFLSRFKHFSSSCDIFFVFMQTKRKRQNQSCQTAEKVTFSLVLRDFFSEPSVYPLIHWLSHDALCRFRKGK